VVLWKMCLQTVCQLISVELNTEGSVKFLRCKHLLLLEFLGELGLSAFSLEVELALEFCRFTGVVSFCDYIEFS
jgi:hypothetical protein